MRFHYQYRDSSNGRFVSEATFRRSKAHGGTRYKRVKVSSPTTPEPEPEGEKPRVIDDLDDWDWEWEHAEDYEDYEEYGSSADYAKEDE